MKTRVYLCAAVLMAITGCASTSRQPVQSVDKLQDLGEKSLAAGETANALNYLTQAEQERPQDAAIQYDLALAYDQRGLQDKAFSHLQKALKIKPDYPEALNTIGYIYATHGQFEQAQAAFQKALDNPFYRTPQFAAYNLGRLYETNGSSDKALSYYQQAVKFDPHYAVAWIGVGRILELQHKDAEARRAYGNAVQASPDMAEAQLRFGVSSYLAGDLEWAARSFNEVRRLAPNSDMADEALRYLEKIASAAPINTGSAPSPDVGPGKIDVIPGENLPANQTEEQSPSSEEENSPAVTNAAKSPGSGPYRYIVQLGSFSEREKAEELRLRLENKGYKAEVETQKDNALGTVFVVQLQPVESISKATTLMTQLSVEDVGKPTVLKVRSK